MVSVEQMKANVAVELTIKVAGDVRAMAQHFLLPAKPASEQERGAPDYMRRLADATAAVEVVCSLVNMFGVMAGLKHFMGESAIADLTFSMNTNQFWVKNSTYLMPIVGAAVNAFQDNRQLYSEGLASGTWRELEYHNRNVWLETLPAILFCLNGHAPMRKQSLEIKQSFEKFLRY
jgi:hypothetical protein